MILYDFYILILYMFMSILFNYWISFDDIVLLVVGVYNNSKYYINIILVWKFNK